MSALREQRQAQRGLYDRARKLLSTAEWEYDRAAAGYRCACVKLVEGGAAEEVPEEELQEREAELAALLLQVRRFSAAAAELKPPPRIGA